MRISALTMLLAISLPAFAERFNCKIEKVQAGRTYSGAGPVDESLTIFTTCEVSKKKFVAVISNNSIKNPVGYNTMLQIALAAYSAGREVSFVTASSANFSNETHAYFDVHSIEGH